MIRHARWGAVLALALLAGCASSRAVSGPEADPWQPVNRPVFRFNDGVDRWVLGPVARGWIWISPEAVRNSVDHFFFNAAFPSRFVSSLGQGEGEKAGMELGRFLVNTTVGVAGFFDPATWLGFERYDEDIGQMLGRWGVPRGPYWVLPLLGPSTPRDAAGLAGDMVLSPFFWVDVPLYGVGLVNVINGRALANERIENARRTALDYYVFVRDAFLENRHAAIHDRRRQGEASSGVYEDVYDTSDEAYEDPEATEDPKE